MLPKRKFNFKQFMENIAILTCLVIFVGGVFVYYKNIPLRFYLFPSLKTSSFEKVGFLLDSNGLVERKNNSSSIYNKLQKNQELFEFDTIKTGPTSTAKIQLTDGSFITLDENSLMVLEFNQKFSFNGGIHRIPQIKVLKGNVESNNLKIVRLDKPLKPKRSLANVQKKKVLVKKIIKKNTIKGIINVFPPKNNKDDILLSWEKYQNQNRYSVLFYEGKNSKSPLIKTRIVGNSFNVRNQDLINKGFYYEVVFESESILASSNRMVFNKMITPPSYFEPQDDSTFFIKKITGGKIVLSWEKTPAEKYLVEISSTKDFKNSKKMYSNNNYIVLKPTQKSTYYWRVTPVLKNNYRGLSSISQKLNIK